MDYAGEYRNNLIIIVNDNDQSIAENHGGLYKNLKELRESNGNCTNNIFESFGLEYHYLEDGHDLFKLVDLFNSVKDIDHPVVLHIHTIKGKGLAYAEKIEKHGMQVVHSMWKMVVLVLLVVAMTRLYLTALKHF